MTETEDSEPLKLAKQLVDEVRSIDSAFVAELKLLRICKDRGIGSHVSSLARKMIDWRLGPI